MPTTAGPSHPSFSVSATAAAGRAMGQGVARVRPQRPTFAIASAQRMPAALSATRTPNAGLTARRTYPAGLTPGGRLPALSHQILRPGGLTR